MGEQEDFETGPLALVYPQQTSARSYDTYITFKGHEPKRERNTAASKGKKKRTLDSTTIFIYRPHHLCVNFSTLIKPTANQGTT